MLHTEPTILVNMLLLPLSVLHLFTLTSCFLLPLTSFLPQVCFDETCILDYTPFTRYPLTFSCRCSSSQIIVSTPDSLSRSLIFQIVVKSEIFSGKPRKFRKLKRSWHWNSNSGSDNPYHPCNNMERTTINSSVCGHPPTVLLSRNTLFTNGMNGLQSI
jgi:hypothetical protein